MTVGNHLQLDRFAPSRRLGIALGILLTGFIFLASISAGSHAHGASARSAGCVTKTGALYAPISGSKCAKGQTYTKWSAQLPRTLCVKMPLGSISLSRTTSCSNGSLNAASLLTGKVLLTCTKTSSRSITFRKSKTCLKGTTPGSLLIPTVNPVTNSDNQSNTNSVASNISAVVNTEPAVPTTLSQPSSNPPTTMEVSTTAPLPSTTAASVASSTSIVTTTSTSTTTTTTTTTVAPSTTAPEPASISYFFGGVDRINLGETTYLWAYYSGTSATVDNGVGAMPLGLSVDVSPSVTTTYTLTVTNGAGSTVTATATIIVNTPTTTQASTTTTDPNTTTTTVPSSPTTTVPTTTTSSSVAPSPASITYFFSGVDRINPGETTYLWTSYSGTSATVDNGVGAMPNQFPVDVSPSVTTTYTLTVTNGAGSTVTATATVIVNTPTTTTLASTTTTVAPTTTTVAPSTTVPATTSTTTAPTTTTTTPVANNVSITSQPSSSSVLLGNTHTFTVAATGTGSLSYQWSLNNVDIDGATSNSYVASDAGTYKVSVTSTVNGVGTSVTSNSATLSFTAATISSHPTDIYVTSGQSRSIGIGISIPNGLTVTYQWYRDNIAIDGAIAQTYMASLQGQYKVQVTSYRNGKTDVQYSNSAAVTVVSPPSITDFDAVARSIADGNEAQLVGVFTGGTGVITPGNISVTSGQQVSVWPNANTTYTLIVTNAAGTQTAQTLQITVTTGSFTNASNAMSVNRWSGSSAVTLSNGKVIIFGSPNQSVFTDIFDPATNSFTRTGDMNPGDMNLGRKDAAAVLLPNGKVLAIGGRKNTPSANDATNLVEIYDPATGTWSVTNHLLTARKYHFAIVLSNGKVLVGGGVSDTGARLLTSELYDPVSGTWSYTGNMPSERSSMGVALLPNGNVFIAGGYGYESGVWKQLSSSAEYDVTAGTWSPIAATMNSSHGDGLVTVALSDGRILIAGGQLAGGEATTVIDIYDPTTHTFVSSAVQRNLSVRRAFFTAHLLQDGKVVFIGGEDGVGGITSTVEVYDPVQNLSVLQVRTMPYERRMHSSAMLLDGRVLIVGGVYTGGNTGQIFEQ